MSRNVNHTLDNTDALVENGLGISDKICYREWATVKVSLKQEIRFNVGAF